MNDKWDRTRPTQSKITVKFWPSESHGGAAVGHASDPSTLHNHTKNHTGGKLRVRLGRVRLPASTANDLKRHTRAHTGDIPRCTLGRRGEVELTKILLAAVWTFEMAHLRLFLLCRCNCVIALARSGAFSSSLRTESVMCSLFVGVNVTKPSRGKIFVCLFVCLVLFKWFGSGVATKIILAVL